MAAVTAHNLLKNLTKLKSPPEKRNRNKYCRYHKDHGHDTEDYFKLKLVIEKLGLYSSRAFWVGTLLKLGLSLFRKARAELEPSFKIIEPSLEPLLSGSVSSCTPPSSSYSLPTDVRYMVFHFLNKIYKFICNFGLSLLNYFYFIWSFFCFILSLLCIIYSRKLFFFNYHIA